VIRIKFSYHPAHGRVHNLIHLVRAVLINSSKYLVVFQQFRITSCNWPNAVHPVADVQVLSCGSLLTGSQLGYRSKEKIKAFRASQEPYGKEQLMGDAL